MSALPFMLLGFLLYPFALSVVFYLLVKYIALFKLKPACLDDDYTTYATNLHDFKKHLRISFVKKIMYFAEFKDIPIITTRFFRHILSLSLLCITYQLEYISC